MSTDCRYILTKLYSGDKFGEGKCSICSMPLGFMATLFDFFKPTIMGIVGNNVMIEIANNNMCEWHSVNCCSCCNYFY